MQWGVWVEEPGPDVCVLSCVTGISCRAWEGCGSNHYLAPYFLLPLEGLKPQTLQPLVSLFKSLGTSQALGAEMLALVAVSRYSLCHPICVVTIAAVTA